jgi:hypothetical protein
MTLTDEQTTVESDGTQELEQGIARSKKLMSECVKFRLSISRFSDSKGFDDRTKDEVAAATGMKKAAISGGKKLFDRNCAPIKDARAAISQVHALVDGMTIPLSHFRESGGKDSGSRLLEIKNADTLNSQLETHKLLIQAAEDNLNDQRDLILESSEKLLGDKFDPSDYPEKFKLEMDWHVEPAILPEYMAAIMPQAYNRAISKAEETFEKTAQGAVEEFMDEFLKVVQHWGRVLGPKVKIYPKDGHELSEFYGAEIVKKHTHDQFPDEIPEDKFRLELAYLPKGKTRQKKHVTEPMGQAEYAELRPQQDTTDKKKFQSSTIKNLMDIVTEFRNVGSMLSAPAGFTTVVDKISAHLQDMGNEKDIADELRNSRSYRASTLKLMGEISDSLEDQIVEVKKKRRKIRRVPTKK